MRVWNLDRGTCAQTLNLAFPGFGVLGKEIEFGRPALYVDTASPNLILVTCCEHLAQVRLK